MFNVLFLLPLLQVPGEFTLKPDNETNNDPAKGLRSINKCRLIPNVFFLFLFSVLFFFRGNFILVGGRESAG